MTTVELVLMVMIVVALVLAVRASIRAKDGEEFAMKAHDRANHGWDSYAKFRTLHTQEHLSLLQRVTKLDKNQQLIWAELFHEGEYPDMGLRDWCREWRGRLRESGALNEAAIADLESRLNNLARFQDAMLQHLKVEIKEDLEPVAQEPIYAARLTLVPTSGKDA
jgi:hypothetical protein